MAGFAWVTLATNDSYSLGALVLANSLRQVGTPHQLAVLVTPGVTNPMREQLRSIFNVVVEVNILDSKDEANLRLLQRPELGVTFTKLHCWRLTQFEKCVFLDADTLVLQNADELFEREELSAAPDVGWPDCFNSGVFVYRPSNETYENLIKFALERGSFDGGDQGLLNLYFSDWAHKDISKHLPFIYNVCSTACYSYLPAFKQFGSDLKIIHFIGSAKPWLQYFDTESRQVQPSYDLKHLQPVLQRWWDIFFSFIQPNLSSEMARSKSPAVHNPQSYPYTSFSPSVSHEPKAYIDYTVIENESGAESDYQNVWDPWDEYETKTDIPSTEFVEHSTELVVESITNIVSGLHESHNTNAHSVLPQPPTPPPPNPPTIPTFHPPNKSHINNSSEIIKIKSAPPPIPIPYIPTPSQHPDVVCIPVENQYFHTNNPSFDISLRIPTPPIENVLSSHIIQAQPHEFEPPCTVANESILHPNDSGSHDNDGDAGLAGAFSQLKLGEPRSPGQLALEDNLRRQGWEVGNIDYLGRDSFENIWKKICETIDSAKPKESTVPPPETPSVPSTVAPEVAPESQKQEQIEAQAATPAVDAPVQPVPTTTPVESAPAAAPVETVPAAVPIESVTPAASTESVTPAATTESVPSVAPVEPASAAAPTDPTPSAVPSESVPAAAPSEPAPAAAPSEPAPAVAPTESAVAVPAAEPVTTGAPTESALPAPVAVPTEPVSVLTPTELPPTAALVESVPVTAPAEALPAAVQATAASPSEAQPAASPPEVAAISSPVDASAPPPETPPTAEAVPAVDTPAELPPADATPVTVPPAPTETSIPAEVAPVSVPTETPPAVAAAEVPAAVPTESAPAAIPAVPAATPIELAPTEVPVAAVPTETKPAAVPTEVPVAAVPAETKPAAVPTEAPPTVAPAEAPPAVTPKEDPPVVATVTATPAVSAPSTETAKGATAPKAKEGPKKAEAKPAATSSEPTSPTPPPRKAGSSPKKSKAKK